MALNNDFYKVTKAVHEGFQALSKKSSHYVKIAKLKYEIYDNEKAIDDIYIEIGKAIYDKYTKGEELNNSFESLCYEIMAITKSISKLEEEISELSKE